MRRLGQICALKAVGTDLFARKHLKIGEKSANEGIGEAVCDLPTALEMGHLATEQILLRIGDQTNEIGKSASDSQKATADGVVFKIEVSGVSLHGVPEKFQTAVLVRCAYGPRFHRSVLIFLCPKANVERLVVVSDLRPRLHGIGILCVL